jgi:hypothetical protein
MLASQLGVRPLIYLTAAMLDFMPASISRRFMVEIWTLSMPALKATSALLSKLFSSAKKKEY